MSINIEKLKNVKYKGSRIVARCPACAEQGNDNKGDHLSIDEQGRFSCVMYPGETGAEHRKRIFALVGIKDVKLGSSFSPPNNVIRVKRAIQKPRKVIKTNVLRRLRRVNLTYSRKKK